MLRSLRLINVGPAERMEITFADRLNIITGDNGLGKSFILDIAWWALTRSWAGRAVLPTPDKRAAPKIAFKVIGKTTDVEDDCKYDFKNEMWKRAMGRPSNPGLVLYAQSDGGFSVWDPARNYWRDSKDDLGADRPRSYVFKPQEVWDGLPIEGAKKQCNGLIADWAAWQREGAEPYEQLCRALTALSPGEDEPLAPGELVRLADDVRAYPTLRMAYGQDVPVVHASAGIKRIIALAYLLVWSWQEHLIASKRQKSTPTKQIVFLIDEIESHLHPKWQRKIFDSVLAVMSALVGGDVKVKVKVQVIVATHSPLVLASLEPIFGTSDQLFDIDLDKNEKGKRTVVIQSWPWEKLGTVDRWLMSDVFNLRQARSLRAEDVIDEVTKVMDSDSLTRAKARKLDAALNEVLSETDPLWLRWRHFVEKRQILPVEKLGS